MMLEKKIVDLNVRPGILIINNEDKLNSLLIKL